MANPKDDTAGLETLKKAQTKKRSGVNPARLLDKAIYNLWETINDLEQLQPEQIRHFRVSIFGSSRIQRGDPIYQEVKELSFELSKAGVDIVTGGGPGLMEAANSGAVEGQAESRARSFGLPIHLPTEENANPFVDQIFKHRTFFSRLHHFVRLSSAYIVMPGGIGTALETFMVWQLLQVKHIKKHPLILVGEMWVGLIEWMKQTMLQKELVSPPDMEIVHIVKSGKDAMPIVIEAYEQFKKEKANASGIRNSRSA